MADQELVAQQRAHLFGTPAARVKLPAAAHPSSDASMSATETLRTQAQARQARRAWLVIAGVSLVFFALLAVGSCGGSTLLLGARHHARSRDAAGYQRQWRAVRTPTDNEWRLVTSTTTVHEGDDVSTALGTVVWLTMFDGSTVEVSEDTIVHVARMRSSRFLNRTKHFILEPQRGARLCRYGAARSIRLR